MGLSLKDIDNLIWFSVQYDTPQEHTTLITPAAGPPDMSIVIYTVIFSCTNFANELIFESPSEIELDSLRIGANKGSQQVYWKLIGAPNELVYITTQSPGDCHVTVGYQIQNVMGL